MRRIVSFAGQLVWGMVWVGVFLALLLFVLHVIRGHVGGVIGTVAADAESAITPRGGNGG